MNLKIITLSCLMLFALLSSGCVSSDQLAGKTYEGPNGEIVRFFEDGKMHCTNEKGVGAMGEYRIEDGRMYFNAVFTTWDADIVGDTLVNGGDVFVLVEQ